MSETITEKQLFIDKIESQLDKEIGVCSRTVSYTALTLFDTLKAAGVDLSPLFSDDKTMDYPTLIVNEIRRVENPVQNQLSSQTMYHNFNVQRQHPDPHDPMIQKATTEGYLSGLRKAHRLYQGK
jgi:hypothetical protein